MNHQKTFRMFLLEDDDNDAFLIQRAIWQAGAPVEVTRFHNPRQAIDALLHYRLSDGEVPDLILTDLKMPGMTGLEFVRWLRGSRFSCIPVIMLSGSALPEDILAAYRSGTNSFSTKPLDLHDLDGIVKTVLQYWKDTCQTPTTALREQPHLAEK